MIIIVDLITPFGFPAMLVKACLESFGQIRPLPWLHFDIQLDRQDGIIWHPPISWQEDRLRNHAWSPMISRWRTKAWVLLVHVGATNGCAFAP